ncbi:MAG: DUF4336 domain-containing protein [Pseudomonadales bacterium]|nr:DUF4336 domain-containing protein [Pseudomonadales bacterium]
MSMLQPFGSELWTMDGDPVRMFAIPFSTRMTIVRLESGNLWVHSPIHPTPGRIDALRSLGTVRHIVAPNRIHSLGVSPFKEGYPNAEVWVSPKFPEAHQDIIIDAVFDSDSVPEWADEIEHHVFRGSFYLDEVVFFHKLSRTLIVTDIIQKHVAANDSFFWRQVKRLVGVLGKEGGVSLDLKASFTNRELARQSKEKVLSWDFDRLVISHGYCVDKDARSIVEKSLSWI